MSKNFCPLPWIHLSVEPSGKVFNCCNTSIYKEVGKLKSNTLEQLFSNDHMRDFRNSFSNGKIPNDCSQCVELEDLGKVSLRQASLKKYPDINSDSRPKLKYLSLRLDNICNYKCRICNAELSTSWYGDSEKLTGSSPEGVISPFRDDEHFINFLAEIPTDLETIYFAGGEPFISPRFHSVIDYLIKNNMKETEVLINTNMSKIMFNKSNILEKLSFFKNVYLDLSIDGIEENGELSRSGMNWEETKKNIFLINKEFPKLKLKLFPTISILNIFHLPKLLTFFLENKILMPNDFVLNPLTLPSHLCISNLPQELKEKVTKDLNYFAKSYLLLNYEIENSSPLISQLNSIKNLLNKDIDQSMFPKFLNETRKLDLLRKESTFKTISELSSFE